MNATTDPDLNAAADVALQQCANDMADAAERGDFAKCGRVLNAAVTLGADRKACESAFAAEVTRREADRRVKQLKLLSEVTKAGR